jgi:hypothetical protein
VDDSAKPTGIYVVGRTRRISPGAAILLAAGVSLSLGGCGSSRAVNTEPVPVITETPSPTATSSPTASPTADPTPAILSAYREFFARQSEISAAPKEARQALLAPFTTDPELNRVLRGMFAAEGFGEVGYGSPVVNPAVAKVDGDTATITDCQDTSEFGQKKKANGKITQHGIKRANVLAKVKRGPDGTWRISFVDYPDNPC